jgi:hypothetical protein
MLLYFEFYAVPPDGSLKHCEKTTFNSSRADHAVGHAEDMLESHTFVFGKANLCLIKDDRGDLVREVWWPMPPLPRRRPMRGRQRRFG